MDPDLRIPTCVQALLHTEARLRVRVSTSVSQRSGSGSKSASELGAA